METNKNDEEIFTFTDFIKSKNDELNYSLAILKNKLKILFISDPSTKKSSASLLVSIGSIYDPMEYEGLAHFCEHMLFMGTEKYKDETEFNNFLTKHCGTSNASTELDNTKFFFEINNDSFFEALDRFSQFFICPIFNENSMQKELNIIASENSQNLLKDSKRIFQLRLSESKKNSKFIRFTSGNHSTLNKPEIRQELIKFYEKHYSSEVMYLCIYTNKEIKEISEYTINLFENVKKLDNFHIDIKENYFNKFLKNNIPFNESNLGYLYKIYPNEDSDKILIDWFLPFNHDELLYNHIPLYWQSIFASYGLNSFGYSLYKDFYIFDYSVIYDFYYEIFGRFTIQIFLTKKGLENWKEILLRLFKYLKIMQNEPINYYYFNEYKNINQLAFDYSSKRQPLTYIKKLCCSLVYSKNDYKNILSEHKIPQYYNEEGLKRFINYLQPNNCNILFFSKSFEKEVNLFEKWYGTKYSKQKFLNNFFTLSDINNYSCNYNLNYPIKNSFIPENVSIIPKEELPSPYPTEISIKKKFKIWYKKDNTFLLPYTYVKCIIYHDNSNSCFSSLKKLVLNLVGKDLLKNDLIHISYMGGLVNLQFDINFMQSKSIMYYYGYNQSLENALPLIMNSIVNIEFLKKENLFLLRKEALTKTLHNFFVINNSKSSKYILTTFMLANICDNFDCIKILQQKEINLQDYVKMIKTYFNNSNFEWLIQGNLTKEQAINIVKTFNKYLNLDENIKIKQQTLRSVDISSKTNYVYRKLHLNPNEHNSSISTFYQCGLISIKEIKILEIIKNFLSDKFYDDIRTKQGLGYTTYFYINQYGKNYGLVNTIQSNVKEPEYLAEKIEEFYLKNFYKITNLSDEEFKSYINNIKNTYKKGFNNLNEEGNFYFSEISTQRYMFNIKEKSIEYLDIISKEEVINFYKKHFIEDVKKIDIEYVSTYHWEINEKKIKNINNENRKIKRVVVESKEEFWSLNCLFPN